jgi:hypothetical protein
VTDESNVVHLPVQPSESGPASAESAQPWGSVSEAEMGQHVDAAMDWLGGNPGSDHLDAAYAIAQRQGGALGHSQWPEFVGRVRGEAELKRDLLARVEEHQAEAEPEVER